MTISSQTISSARQVRLEELVERHGIKLRGPVERMGPCPICGGRDKFSINVRKQVWNCRGCGQGGDVIALAQFVDGSDFPTAVATLAGMLGLTGKPLLARGPTKTFAEIYERRQRNKARRLWRASQIATETPAEVYLQTRGIIVPLPTVRYLPPLKPGHHPAMLVPYGLPREPEPGVLDIAEHAIAAVQLTLLKPDGSGKADVEKPKITIGSPAGMPIVLAPMNDLLGLAICEGVEDALSVHQATGLGAWATGGAGFMPKIAKAVPDYVECVTVFVDDDEDGQRYATALAEALPRRIEVRLAASRKYRRYIVQPDGTFRRDV